MDQSNVVILGGGMVADAAKQLMELGLPKGELAILSADNAVPYERPPLSKSFLAGKDSEDAIKINAEDFYKKHGIELRLQCVVNDLNKRWSTQNQLATSLAVILFLHNHLPSFRGGALYTHDYGDALGNRVRDDAPVLPRHARVPAP
jgi:hypothetical protein